MEMQLGLMNALAKDFHRVGTTHNLEPFQIEDGLEKILLQFMHHKNAYHEYQKQIDALYLLESYIGG